MAEVGLGVDLDDLVTTSEVADMLGVGVSAISNYKQRHEDFPKPLVAVNRGRTDLYSRKAIVAWWMKRADPKFIEAIRRG